MSTKNKYILDFADPNIGGHTEEYLLDSDFWCTCAVGEEVLGGSVTATVQVSRVHSTLYLVQLHFDGSLQVPCDRCLLPLEVSVDTDEEFEVALAEEYDDTDDSRILIDRKNALLELDALMYEIVVLNLPMQRMHPVEECDQEMRKYIINEPLHEYSDRSDGKMLPTEEDPTWLALKGERTADEKINN